MGATLAGGGLAGGLASAGVVGSGILAGGIGLGMLGGMIGSSWQGGRKEGDWARGFTGRSGIYKWYEPWHRKLFGSSWGGAPEGITEARRDEWREKHGVNINNINITTNDPEEAHRQIQNAIDQGAYRGFNP